MSQSTYDASGFSADATPGQRPEALREYVRLAPPFQVRTRNLRTASRWPTLSVTSWCGVSLTLIAVAAALWVYILRDRLIVKKWGTVKPGVVYRSGQISRYLILPTLQEHHIKHIICMTSPDSNDVDQQAELAAAEELGIDYKFLPLNGRGIGKVEHFTGAVTQLATNAKLGEPVLIHCHAGAQRTGGVVAAYRLLVEGRSPDFVFSELRKYGWNPKRDQVLIDFVNAHLNEAAVELVAAGCLEKIPQPLPVLR